MGPFDYTELRHDKQPVVANQCGLEKRQNDGNVSPTANVHARLD